MVCSWFVVPHRAHSSIRSIARSLLESGYLILIVLPHVLQVPVVLSTDQRVILLDIPCVPSKPSIQELRKPFSACGVGVLWLVVRGRGRRERRRAVVRRAA